MAFKSVDEFNKERYAHKFILDEDGASADVIFLYTSRTEMLKADVHYIKSPDYSGYVHCLGKGCPACARKPKPIPVQANHLFIPLYNIAKDEIEFWDRKMPFDRQMVSDVFDKHPNPSEVVFTITRSGAYRDPDTRYSMVAIGRNKYMSYSDILAKFNAKFPDYYETIVRSVTVAELSQMLSANNFTQDTVEQDYVPVPRAGYQPSIPDTYVNASDAVGDTVELPDITSISDVTENAEDDLIPPPDFA
jgi:hypothetical protein